MRFIKRFIYRFCIVNQTLSLWKLEADYINRLLEHQKEMIASLERTLFDFRKSLLENSKHIYNKDYIDFVKSNYKDINSALDYNWCTAQDMKKFRRYYVVLKKLKKKKECEIYSATLMKYYTLMNRRKELLNADILDHDIKQIQINYKIKAIQRDFK